MRKILAFTLCLAGAALASGAKPPASAAGSLIEIHIEEASGAFLEGEFLLYLPKTGNAFIGGSPETGEFDAGTYQYTVQNDRAVLTTWVQYVGFLNYEITFDDDSSGSFAVDSPFGTQSGTFDVNWLYDARNAESLRIHNVISTPANGGEVVLTVEVQASSDMQTWQTVEGRWEVDDDGKLEFRASKPDLTKFYRIVGE